MMQFWLTVDFGYCLIIECLSQILSQQQVFARSYIDTRLSSFKLEILLIAPLTIWRRSLGLAWKSAKSINTHKRNFCGQKMSLHSILSSVKVVLPMTRTSVLNTATNAIAWALHLWSSSLSSSHCSSLSLAWSSHVQLTQAQFVACARRLSRSLTQK